MASTGENPSSVKKKRSYNLLPDSRKLELLKKLEAGVPRKKLMEEYNVANSTIGDIKKQECKFYKCDSNCLHASSNKRKDFPEADPYCKSTSSKLKRGKEHYFEEDSVVVNEKCVQLTAMDPSLQEIEDKIDDVECKAEEEFLYEEELSYPDSNAVGEGHNQSKKNQENDDTSSAQTYEKVKPLLKEFGVRSQVLHDKKLLVEEVRLKAEEARLNAFNKMASFFENAEEFLDSYSDMMRALSQGEGLGRRGPRSKGPQTVKED